MLPPVDSERPSVGVPVLIDARRQIPGGPRRAFDMVRCTYLLIESNDPGAAWTIDAGDARLPYMLLSLRGVVISPPEGRGDLFTSPDDIEALYDFVEDRAKLVVDVGDLWIPSALFADGDPYTPGAAYRIDVDVFETAILFRESRIDIAAFLDRMSGFAPGVAVTASPEEAEAFAAWNRQQIGLAVEQYPKAPAYQLSYLDGDTPPEANA